MPHTDHQQNEANPTGGRDLGQITYHCDICGEKLGNEFFTSPLMLLCERCAIRAQACTHPIGETWTRYDADGCGYEVFHCHECHLTFHN